jgi:hypothetical protein
MSAIDDAVCTCGHGSLEHMSHGCEPFLRDGQTPLPCACKLRRHQVVVAALDRAQAERDSLRVELDCIGSYFPGKDEIWLRAADAANELDALEDARDALAARVRALEGALEALVANSEHARVGCTGEDGCGRCAAEHRAVDLLVQSKPEPTERAAPSGPTDGEMLDWLERDGRPMRFKAWVYGWEWLGDESRVRYTTLRGALRAAMEAENGRR